MTLNDMDLLFLSELLAQSKLQDTRFAERIEASMNKRLILMNGRMTRLIAQMDEMTRAKERVNDVTWYGGKRD
jgi:hypothetical protein